VPLRVGRNRCGARHLQEVAFSPYWKAESRAPVRFEQGVAAGDELCSTTSEAVKEE
jgi:hypothetical protein